jgi:class III poly(R)-hydroxyalkanoic acid synthase PhaE subunit
MAEESQTANAWVEAWMDAQRKYWDTWSELSRQAVARSATAASLPKGWAQGLDSWWTLTEPALPDSAREASAKLFDLGKGYLSFGEQFWKAMSSAQAAERATDNWQAIMQRGLEVLKESFLEVKEGSGGSAGDPWSGFATFWGMPLDMWRRVSSACSVFPGDVVKALRGDGAPGPTDILHGALNRFLSAPTLGYTREWQEQFQQLGQLWLQYTDALQRYGEVLNRIGSCAVDLLRDRLMEMGKKGEVIEGMRSAYDLWVDCGEEAYAQIASGSEFADAQACLVNALMALKRHEQQLVEEVLAGLNMPTRSELDTAHRRIQQLRREVQSLQSQLEDSDFEGLRQEMVSLRAKVTRRGAAGAPGTRGATASAVKKAVSSRRRTQTKEGAKK